MYFIDWNYCFQNLYREKSKKIQVHTTNIPNTRYCLIQVNFISLEKRTMFTIDLMICN